MAMNESHATLEQAIPRAKRLYTYDELAAEFPETNQPCELWDGELVMSPASSFDHQEIVLRIARRVQDWVSERNLGNVITSPIDMVLSPTGLCNQMWASLLESG